MCRVENASPTGIVQGHAYSFLDAQEVDGVRLVKLRNPWGGFEWKGPWNDDDTAHWTERFKKKLNFVKADDGCFWMEFGDFVTNYEDVYICRFFEEPKWKIHPQIDGEWKGFTAGGCTNFATVANNPMYGLYVRGDTPVNIVLVLSQEDVRMMPGKKNFPIAIEVYDNGGNRINQQVQGKQVMTNEESYIFRREVLAEATLPPSKTPYTILVSTFNQSQERKFVIKAFSDLPIEILPLPMK